MTTQINELVLRVAGINKEQGNRLGGDVAQLVGERLPKGIGDHNIPELKIQLPSSQSSDHSSLASSIADQIVRQVKLSIYNT